jgi:regulator of extracellular matrix RemA (YlzA/DUF370 family)
MFLHIGGDAAVSLNELVAILDLEAAEREPTKEFLGFAADEKTVIHVGNQDRKKSIIITNNRIYISPISVTTLLKRSHFQDDEGNNLFFLPENRSMV